MSKFKVTYQTMVTTIYEVEANSPDEALEQAQSIYSEDSLNDNQGEKILSTDWEEQDERQ